MAIFIGTALGEVITGTKADDYISGEGGADTLNGLLGNDILNGGAIGVGDTMSGGIGNDNYIVDSLLDNANETLNVFGGGIDRIYSGISYNLSIAQG